MKSQKKTANPDTGLNEIPNQPNILMIMVDEYRYPRYDSEHGMAAEIKNIVGFKQGDTSTYEQFFPGLMRLRQNSVVFADHTIASSACIPSRAALFTGQYGTRTGVTQTDGVFKSGEDPRFNWLEPDGAPTMGDWLKVAGYETYYFGKCHFADPPMHTLEEFGFDAWESSFPEPHGTLQNNLGLYRDYGFADLVTTFLKRKGLALDYDKQVALGDEESAPKPWFAVASFTNPHDITTWPVLPAKVDPSRESPTEPLYIPEPGKTGEPAVHGTWRIPLNPTGFPGVGNEVAKLPPNFGEDLRTSNKPSCHYEYSLKLGLALACKTGSRAIAASAPSLTGMPFKLSDDGAKWGKAYLEYYTYLHSVVDQHINSVMQTLDQTGLSENTIVLFVPDHGEYGGAHGGMVQKWHTAYQETLQVPVVVCMPSSIKEYGSNGPKQINKLTSHIDLLPTLLGLAGVEQGEIDAIKTQLQQAGHHVDDLVGADLSKLIMEETNTIIEPDSQERKGVLFATDDMITEYITDNPRDFNNLGDPNNLPEKLAHLAEYRHDYELFLTMVPQYASRFTEASGLQNGPIAQPCHLVCYREDNWKLVRYASQEGHTATDDPNEQFEWELYDLSIDDTEVTNLLQVGSQQPTVLDSAALPTGYNRDTLQDLADNLYAEMLRQINSKLAPQP